MWEAISERIAFYCAHPGESLWLAFGVLGQLVFASRFVVQWFVSERQGRSVMPISFWYLSVIGSLMTITYGIYRLEPVIVIGQFGLFIYLRNLVLIHRERANKMAENTPKAEEKHR